MSNPNYPRLGIGVSIDCHHRRIVNLKRPTLNIDCHYLATFAQRCHGQIAFFLNLADVLEIHKSHHHVGQILLCCSGVVVGETSPLEILP
jgi:hypothetical protein